jgi:hypothetical protein
MIQGLVLCPHAIIDTTEAMLLGVRRCTAHESMISSFRFFFFS